VKNYLGSGAKKHNLSKTSVVSSTWKYCFQVFTFTSQGIIRLSH